MSGKARKAGAGPDVAVDRGALLAALTAVKPALPSRRTEPLLAGVVLEAAGGALTVSGYDRELSARIRLDAAVASAGRVLLEGRMLHEVVKNSQGRDVVIRADGDKATIAPGTSVFTVRTLPVEQYPVLPALPVRGGGVFVQQFFAAVKKVLTATGRGDSLPALAGIRVEFDGGKMVLVSTDRFRLATAELTWFPDEPAEAFGPMLIPGAVLKLITSRWGRATGLLRIAQGDDDGRELAGFSLGEEAYTCRMLGGDFVDHRALFAPEYPIGAVVETKPLIAAARLVALVADATSPIRLSFAHGRVDLEAGDETRGSETVPCILDGEPFGISLNPAFLLDGLNVLGRDFVRIGITAPSRPLVLTAHHDPRADLFDGFRYLMVPLRA